MKFSKDSKNWIAFFLVLGSLFSFILVRNVVQEIGLLSRVIGFGFFILLPALGLLACVAGLYVSRRSKLVIVINLCAVSVSFLAADLYVARSGAQVRGVEHSANDPAMSRDARKRLDVVRDLRGAGVKAYPTYSVEDVWKKNFVPGPAPGQRLSGFEIGGKEAIPLTNASKVTVVVCNETGRYLQFETDEMGFNNPRGLWDSGPMEVAVIGDSYVLGYCVSPDDNLVSGIRKRYHNVLNVGVGGAGPLTELAVLREYVARVRPNKVLWIYFENDLENLEEEKRFELHEILS